VSVPEAAGASVPATDLGEERRASAMIIDSHLHFYDAPRHDSAFSPVHDHLSFDEVRAAAREIGVDRFVQVTPAAVGYDNNYSFAIAKEHPDCVFGVIARLNPVDPSIDDQLRRAMALPQMLALRLTLIEKHSEAWLEERRLDGFFAFAQELGVPLELFAPFRVKAMHETVRRFPGIRWLIDHIGLRYYEGKDNREAFRQWDDLLDLAEEPNAWIKCSYFPEAAKDLETYPYPTAQLYLRRLYDRVGAERLVWGSNFPNVRRACTYRQALDFIRIECAFLSERERAGLLGDNFRRYVAREGGVVQPGAAR
jgi:predicted TIM-barrel fold metal-dependent hydrolase